ncbi:MAG TPA: hypothetical protein VI455_08185 [Terriglobia bacterium]
MKRLWQQETGRLACRWSNGAERVRYDIRWIEDASAGTYKERVAPLLLDFSRVSPFGREWYVHDRPR